MRIPYGTGAYRRDNGNLPELRLVNMYLESATTGEEGVVLLSRKGLTEYANLSNNPIEGLFQEDNVFSGSVFAVSGGVLYKDSIPLGSINGTGRVTFAAGASDELAVCAGGSIYRYDGSTLAAVSFPDSANVTCITFHDGHYIAAKANSHTWYWSAVLDADTWAALDFSSAEARPDILHDIQVIGDNLLLIGSETIERWSNTGDADAPYSRIEGAIINKGTRSTGCSTEIDNRLFIVGSDHIVYVLEENLQRVSDHSIEERIEASPSTDMFSFVFEGHSFVCIRLTNETFVFDIATGQWSEFATSGKSNWRVRTACRTGSETLLGDSTTGKIWTFDGWEDGDDTLERLFTAAFPIKGGVVVVDSLLLEANVGRTGVLSGQGSSPKVEMRSSRTAGALWNTWRQASLGGQGEYRIKTQFRRCGMFDFPGAMFEIRVTDPVPFRVSGVYVNEPGGGVSR